MLLSSRKGRWRDNPAPFILFNFVVYLVLSDATFGTTLQKLSLEHLTREAEVIVRGRIEKVSSEETPDRSNITTLVEVAVEEQWKGPETRTVALRQPGGSVGGITQVVSGLAQFSVGEEAILFLKTAEGGRFVTVGGNQGKLVVMIDPGSRKETIKDVTGKSQSLSDFLHRLSATLK